MHVEPLTKAEAAKFARALLADGAALISTHCYREMAQERITELDIVLAVRHGATHKADLREDGTYSYKFVRRGVAVAVSFRFDAGKPVRVIFRTTHRVHQR